MFGLSIVAAGCLEEDREKHTGPVAWPDSMVNHYYRRGARRVSEGSTLGARGYLPSRPMVSSL